MIEGARASIRLGGASLIRSDLSPIGGRRTRGIVGIPASNSCEAGTYGGSRPVVIVASRQLRFQINERED